MKNTYFMALVALVMLSFSFSAFATNTLPEEHRIDLHNGYSVVFQPIAVVKGKSQEMVLNKVAKVLQNFTSKTHMEACGDITMNPNGVVRVVVGTIHAHSGCITYSENTEGFVVTGLTIHSHPSRRTFRANQADVSANSAAEGTVIQLMRVGQVVATSRHSNTFSKTDLLAKMGYLVAAGHLLYQYNGHVVDKGIVENLPVKNVTVVQ